MQKQPSSEFIHLAMPFGGMRYDTVRVAMGYGDSIKSVPQLVERFCESGRVDSYQNRRKTVHMDEMEFPFSNILVGRHNYEQLVIHAHDKIQKGEGYPLFVIVRVVADYSQNDKGKQRYLCDRASGLFENNENIDVRPILVTERAAQTVLDEMIEWGHNTFLVAARPFIHRSYSQEDGAIHIFLTVADLKQIAPISPEHWDKPAIKKAGQHTMAPNLVA